MTRFPLPSQKMTRLLTALSFRSTKKEREGNKKVEQIREEMYQLGEKHHMEARLKTPNQLGYFNGETLIDVGCGYGKYLRYFKLQKKIKFCVGVDLKKKAIHSTRHLFRNQGIDTPLIIGDAQNLPFEDNSFDIVFSTDVVEHLSNKSKGIQEITRVSKDKVVVCVPNKLNPIDMSHVAEIFGTHNPPEIEEYLTRFQLMKMLQNTGIRTETIVIVEKSFLPLGWFFVNKRMLLPVNLVKFSVFLEALFERVPLLKHTAGVLVSCGRKT